MTFYSVEAINKGKKRGIQKYFDNVNQAKKFASKQYYVLKKGVVIDRVTEYKNGGQSQKTIVSKGLGKTALAKGKFGKDFTRDTGKLSKYSTSKYTQPQKKRYIPNIWGY
jgi:hypothetical protein